MKKIIRGRIWTLGANISTDMIVPSRVLTTEDDHELVSATLENILPDFANRVSLDDILIAGANFGCGSSREEAVYVLKQLKLGAIIAESYARIFYRNGINLGLPLITHENTLPLGNSGEELELNLELATIRNLTQQTEFSFKPFPPFIQQMINQGGAINWLKSNKDSN